MNKVKRSEMCNILVNSFKKMFDIINSEGLAGDKALRNMSYLLILKLLEPHLGNDIKIEINNINKDKLLANVRFSNLINVEDKDLPASIKEVWDNILSIHPATEKIFIKGGKFDIQQPSTYKELIKILTDLDLSHIEYDVLGNAYEEVISTKMTGKVLGQYFTQPLIKKMMVKLMPQHHQLIYRLIYLVNQILHRFLRPFQLTPLHLLRPQYEDVLKQIHLFSPKQML